VAAPSDLPPPEASPEEARRAAEEILERPEFDEPPESFLEKAFDWVADRLGDLLGNLFSGGGSSGVSWLFLLVLVGVVAFLVWRVIRTIQSTPRGGEAFTIATDVGRPPTDWDAEAAEHERAGRWRDALRCRHRALVARLARRGVVEEIPGRTAGEYRLEVKRAAPDVDPEFSEATQLFEVVWYGGRDAGPPEGERFRALADRVLEGAAP